MEDLNTVLSRVNWNENVSNFIAEPNTTGRFQRGCHLIAVWGHELRFQQYDNPANPFLMEMKASAATVPTCSALGLYKPGAASMRAAVENALYFSFFLSHPAELHSQVAKTDYYATKTTIIEYHKTHTPHFNSKQRAVGLLSELESWYGDMSAIIHGQKPGSWSSRGIAQTKYDVKLDILSADAFSRCVAIINMLFLIVIPDETWDGFNSKSRRLFLKGFSKAKKQVIGRSII